MSKPVKTILVGAAIVALLIVFTAVSFGFEYAGNYLDNKREYKLQKLDDETKYESLKVVEDSARSFISSYESDRLVYEQYKDSYNADKQSWGEQAKMRANKTASTYNNYILKNSFLWEGNIPDDIETELPIIK